MSITKAAMYGGDLSYDVPNSGVFASENMDHLSWTPLVSGNTNVWTFSCWVKRTELGKRQDLLSAGFYSSGPIQDIEMITFQADDKLLYFNRTNNTQDGAVESDMVFRDVGEYYHICVCRNASTLTMWVNGNVINTTTIESMTDNAGVFSQTNEHRIGKQVSGLSNYESSMYLAEVNFIDGHALTPNDFAEADPRTNQWNPKKYTGSFGTNGFYLDFRDDVDLGKDSSSNGNDWVNSGVTQSTNTPTDNHAIYSVLDSAGTISNAGTTAAITPTNPRSAVSSIAVSSGKWYMEAFVDSTTSDRVLIGVIDAAFDTLSAPTSAGGHNDGVTFFAFNGDVFIDGISSSYGSSFTSGDTIGIALNLDDNEVEFFIDNVSQGTVTSKVFTGSYKFFIANGGFNATVTLNTPESSWSFPENAPSGFKALSSKNLPEPTVRKSGKYFKAFTYTGNGAGLQVGYDVQDIDIYPLNNSGAFSAEDTDYLNWTPSETGNRKTWTLSTWVKRSELARYQSILCCQSSAGYFTNLYFDQLDQVELFHRETASNSWVAETIGYPYKDVTDFYHVVLVFDTTQSIESNRFKVYINGIEQPVGETSKGFMSQNQNGYVNTAGVTMYIGVSPDLGSKMNGYYSETHFIDGQALNADDFGQKDGNGYWVPKQYTGVYGTNGFHLDFEDSADLGKDVSGNDNHWSNNGVNQTTDNPSNNHAVLNSLGTNHSTQPTGVGLQYSPGGTAPEVLYSTIPIPSTGKWYWEVKDVNAVGNTPIGISAASSTDEYLAETKGVAYWGEQILVDGVSTQSGLIPPIAGQIIGVLVDADANTIEFRLDNVANGMPENFSEEMYAGVGNYISGITYELRFTEDSWMYAPPEGYLALSSNNIPDEEAFVDSPDLVIIKSRDLARSHYTYDSERGPTWQLKTNLQSVDETEPHSLQEFNRGGFRVGSYEALNNINERYVAWVWNKGAIPGFDIVSYVSDGNAGRTLGHNLGKKPAMMIIKNRDNGIFDWVCYHKGLGATQNVRLNTTAAAITQVHQFNDTEPTDTVFTVGNSTGSTNNSPANNYIAYLFAEVEGFSKFGSYDGNGNAEGPFIYCGFRPAYVMIKRTDALSNWGIKDTTRNDTNVADYTLLSDVADAEYGPLNTQIDFLSNGFKIRDASTITNASGGRHIYIAFAEAPFKYSRAR